MGGPNSGRWGGCPTVEACGSIVLDLSKMLALRAGLDTFGLAYSGRLGSPYRITVTVHLGPEDWGKLTILHSAFSHLSEPVPAACYTIGLQAVPWRFGSRRWFMICPQSGRRASKLYLPNGAHRFAGREALGLAYRSQRLDPIQKGHARLARAFAKLGTQYHCLHQAIPGKPKWMRLKTYDRLVADIEAATGRHRETYTDRLRGLLASEDQAFAEAMDSSRRRRR